MSSFDFKRTWGPEPRYANVLGWNGGAIPFPCVIAGPCSIESKEQIDLVIPALKQNHVTFARGGVYRAGTYPPKNGVYGLQFDLMKEWSKECREHGLKPIVEVLDIRQIDTINQYADAFQVGARHCQDYALLRELSQSKKVVTLKRGPGMTLDEFLGAAEYLAQGRCTPILIERGSATHANWVRWDLSISLIAAVKAMGVKIPILVDASHGTGRRDLVEPMTLAGIAAGADGFLVEVHPQPEWSLSDSDQALPLEALERLIEKAWKVRIAVR